MTTILMMSKEIGLTLDSDRIECVLCIYIVLLFIEVLYFEQIND